MAWPRRQHFPAADFAAESSRDFAEARGQLHGAGIWFRVHALIS
jgi:hypothetical protein